MTFAGSVIRIILFWCINSYYALGHADGLAQALDNLDVTYIYHEHIDANGDVVTGKDYLSTNGGCYTKYGAVSETISLRVDECSYDSELKHWNSWGNCPQCGRIWTGVNSSTGIYVSHTHSIGYYYLLNCGKTTESIESVIVNY